MEWWNPFTIGLDRVKVWFPSSSAYPEILVDLWNVQLVSKKQWGWTRPLMWSFTRNTWIVDYMKSANQTTLRINRTSHVIVNQKYLNFGLHEVSLSNDIEGQKDLSNPLIMGKSWYTLNEGGKYNNLLNLKIFYQDILISSSVNLQSWNLHLENPESWKYEGDEKSVNPQIRLFDSFCLKTFSDILHFYMLWLHVQIMEGGGYITI